MDLKQILTLFESWKDSLWGKIVLGTIALILLVLLLLWVWRFFVKWQVRRNLGIYYPSNRLRNLSKHFIKPHYFVDKPKQRFDLISFFMQQVFDPKHLEHKRYLLLGKHGGGKTSALLYLWQKYNFSLVGKAYKIHLVDLAHPQAINHIKAIQKPEKSILLLDSLEEDLHIYSDFKLRLDEILHTTEVFARVIIASRTSLFSDKVLQPGETQAKYVGESNFQFFGKCQLSPLNESESFSLAAKMLKKTNSGDKLRFKERLSSDPYLLQLPGYLSIISKGYYNESEMLYPYRVYRAHLHTLLGRYIQSELIRKKRFALLADIASWMYNHREEHGAFFITQEDLMMLVGEHELPWRKSRENILRQTSDKRWIFEYRGIMAYLLAWKAFHENWNSNQCRFEAMPLAAEYYLEMCWERLLEQIDPSSSLYRVGYSEKRPLFQLHPTELGKITRLYLTEFKHKDLRIFRGLHKLRGLYLNCKSLGEIPSKWVAEIPIRDYHLYLMQEGRVHHVFVPDTTIAELHTSDNRIISLSADTFTEIVPSIQLAAIESVVPARPEIGKTETFLLRLFKQDLLAIPNPFCKLSETLYDRDGDPIETYNWTLGLGAFDLFNEAKIFMLSDGSYNILFKNTYRPTLIVPLLENIVRQIVNVMGEDDRNNTYFDKDDEAQVEDGFWPGRIWAWHVSHRYAFPVNIYMDKPGQVSMLICGLKRREAKAGNESADKGEVGIENPFV